MFEPTCIDIHSPHCYQRAKFRRKDQQQTYHAVAEHNVLEALVIPAVAAAAHSTLLRKFGRSMWGGVVEAQGKQARLDLDQVVFVPRIERDQLLARIGPLVPVERRQSTDEATDVFLAGLCATQRVQVLRVPQDMQQLCLKVTDRQQFVAAIVDRKRKGSPFAKHDNVPHARHVLTLQDHTRMMSDS